MSVESLKSIFDDGAVVLVFLTFIFATGALITGNVINKRQAAQLRQFDQDLRDKDVKIAEAQRGSDEANAVATKAKEGLVVAEQHSAEANAKAEAFRLEIAKAGESSAQANARAAEAQQMAESERLERVKLESLIAPRSLSVADQISLSNALSSFAGTRVRLTTYSLDGEGALLGKQIIAILQVARITVDDRTASLLPMGAFSLGVHVTGSNGSLVGALRDSLSKIGHLAVAPPNTSTSQGAAMQAIPRDPGIVDAEILVGVKPIPIIR